MSNQPIDKSKLTESILKAMGGKIDRDAVNAAANGDPKALLGSLNEKDRQMLSQMLNNPGLISKLFNDDATKKLLNDLSGGKKNG
ncbi:MAG: hypothetical protein E7562_01275 [Ruminococcaceae bacterium]|nr:hypothetical protein [Oscillospiraceae bacterium]